MNYLDQLADDGVTLDAVETDVVSEDGERVLQHFLLR